LPKLEYGSGVVGRNAENDASRLAPDVVLVKAVYHES
jgi:hypothetical protein